ncbi:MAG: cytochrome P450 [Gemmatimonadetes bacterium]|nr:cytochrome P450 [Gemmatimonadota bacterium]MYC90263.1 cytochrome P450 [Gemmatimonadota bacterium]
MMMLRKAVAGIVRSAYIHTRLAEERLRSGVAWWPLAPGFVANPYPVYRRLRERDPVHYSILTDQVVVTRYADVDRILRDHRNFSNNLHKARSSRGSLATRKKLKPSMLVQDPPDHTRLRGLVNRAFTPPSVANMEDYIRATAHTLLDAVESHDEFDLMTAYAGPLPTLVIARMIGVPESDLNRFKVWSKHLVRALEPLLTPEEEELVYQNEQLLADYHMGIIEQRRRDPRDDLVSRLVEAEEQGDRLTLDEMIVMLRLLLIAGNETTTNLIGNGRFVRSRTMIAPAIGAANRDPERFERPDEVDITRSDAGNISFGRGIHHCLGAPLARLEGRIALEVLLERFARIGFGKRPPRYRRSIVLRGLEHFDIRAIPRGCSAEGPTGA